MKINTFIHFLFAFILSLSMTGAIFHTAHAASIVVDTASDVVNNGDGVCSLREAIENANADNPAGPNTNCAPGNGADVITFSGSFEILLTSTLPTITDADGLTIIGGGNVILNGQGNVRVLQSNTLLTLDGMVIKNGNATSLSPSRGGGVYNNGGTLTVSNSVLQNNTSTFGGGVHSLNGRISITNSWFDGNTALNGGAGLILIGTSAGTHTISNSLFTNNVAYNAATDYGTGAGIQVQDSVVVNISNSTFYNNQANGGTDDGGGAIMVYNGTATVTNSTLAGNGSAAQGGGVRRMAGTITLVNTILDNNTNGNCSGNVLDGSGNLAYGDNTCPVTFASGDPVLQTLADNGGPTQTMALGASSLAVNAGDAAACATLATDQRGENRRNGFCDAGAYEAQPSAFINITGDSQNTVIDHPFPNPLAAYVVDGYDNALAGVDVTFSAPASGASATFSSPVVTSSTDGAFSATATANSLVGAYTVTASSGSATPAEFDLTNTDLQVVSIQRLGSNPTNAATVDFLVTFNTEPTNVDPTDFTLAITGSITGESVSLVGSAGQEYTVSVSTGTGDGTIRLDLVDDDSIVDTFSHPLGGPGAGNGNFESGETFTIDKTLPVSTITSSPPLYTNSVSAQFEFSSEPGSTFECSLDGSVFTLCTSPVNYTGLSEQAHTFQVRATDLAGNVESLPVEYQWTIDLTAPDTSITGFPSNPSNSSTAIFTFTSSPDTQVVFECNLDGAAFESCPADYTNLINGSHRFEVRAKDAAGNVDATPAFYEWVIDTVPPETTILSYPNDPTNATTASFTYNSSESGSSFECSLDGAAFGACPASYTNLVDGLYVFKVRAIDPAGNVDPSPAEYSWVVDTVAPNTSLLSYPDSPTAETTANFTYQSDDPDAVFECSLDGAGFSPCPSNYSGLLDGEHRFEVRAVDEAGNADTSPAEYTWIVDTAAPETTLTGYPDNPTNSTSASFTYSSNEEPDVTYECKLDTAGFGTCQSNYLGLSDGNHTFYVRATDAAGNTDLSPAEYTWTIVTVGPRVSLNDTPNDPSNVATALFTFTVTEGGLPIDSVLCWLDSQTPSDCSSGAFTTPSLSDGKYTFHVEAKDVLGNASPVSFTWTIDTTPPTASIDSRPTNPSNSSTATFVYTSNEQNVTFECSLDGGQFGACPANYPGLADGEHTFTVRATDLAGNTGPATPDYTWEIDTVEPTAAIDSVVVTGGVLVSVTWSGADDNTGVAYYQVQVRDNGGSWTTWLDNISALSGIFIGAPGRRYDFQVRAVDAAGNFGAWSPFASGETKYLLFLPQITRQP